MRIIITKNGKIFFREFEIDDIGGQQMEKNEKSNFIQSYNEMNDQKAEKRFRSLNAVKFNQKLRSIPFLKKKLFNKNNSVLNIKNIRAIRVSQNKLNLTQPFLKKYDNTESSLKENIDSIAESKEETKGQMQSKNGNFLIPIKNSSNKSIQSFYSSKVALGDIISKNSLIALKSKLLKDIRGHNDIRIPLDNKNKSSFNFRTKYENKETYLDNLSLILNYPLNASRSNIIDYYRVNKNISPFYLEKLVKSNEDKIAKLNNVCKKILTRREREKNDEMIKKRIKIKKEKLFKDNIKNSIESIERIMNKTSEIFREYKLDKKQNKDIFFIKLETIKKECWSKHRIGSLGKKNSMFKTINYQNNYFKF